MEELKEATENELNFDAKIFLTDEEEWYDIHLKIKPGRLSFTAFVKESRFNIHAKSLRKLITSSYSWSTPFDIVPTKEFKKSPGIKNLFRPVNKPAQCSISNFKIDEEEKTIKIDLGYPSQMIITIGDSRGCSLSQIKDLWSQI